MSKKHQLEKHSYSDTGLAGIVSHLPDYRIVHFLNKELKYTLAKLPDMSVSAGSKSEVGKFSFYSCYNKEYSITFCLIGNKSEDFILVPQLKNIDYFLLMMNLSERYNITEIAGKVRAIPGVIMVQWIEPDKIPRINEILGLTELHLLSVKDKNR